MTSSRLVTCLLCNIAFLWITVIVLLFWSYNGITQLTVIQTKTTSSNNNKLATVQAVLQDKIDQSVKTSQSDIESAIKKHKVVMEGYVQSHVSGVEQKAVDIVQEAVGAVRNAVSDHPHRDITANLTETNKRLEYIEGVQTQQHKTILSRVKIIEHELYDHWGVETEATRRCDLECNRRGVSGRIGSIVPRCQCLCAGGWSGTRCQTPPKEYDARAFAVDSHPAVIPQIPLTWNTLPPKDIGNSSRWEPCRNATLAYYLSKYKSLEYRTDAALKFFYFICQNSLTPVCSTPTKKIVLVDIGANIGQLFPFWIREFLNYTHCETNTTTVFAVEPNPYNTVLLRHNIQKKYSKSFHSGGVEVVEGAVSYYNGEASLNVSPVQNIGANGNERGSLGRNEEVNATNIIVPIYTLDSLLFEKYKLNPDEIVLPLLKIDAEGFDAAVLYGAQRTLSLAQVVVFECHKLWTSAGYKMGPAAEYLAKLGFDTFKMGQYYWIRMTPPEYWDDVYDETMTWSNCIAVRKGHPFAHLFPRPEPCTAYS
eukprot:PhF_6_TR4535/c0_g1_i1/m.6379